MSTVSVIIPVFNHLSALKKSLFSLNAQTTLPYEVIVVDDGSTDGDVERAVAEASLKCKTMVLHQKNAGASSARNRGFNKSTGELVIFWDADTIAKPEMLEKLEKALEDNVGASYAYCSFKFGWKKMPSKAFDSAALLKNNFIDTTTLVRREAIGDLAGPFDENLKRFQDWDLWLTLLEKGRTGVFVPEFLYKKLVGFRGGISSWLPKFYYSLFSFSTSVKEYDLAKQKVIIKHAK